MREWFGLRSGVSADGFFLRHELYVLDGGCADQIPAFVDQLVEHLVGYAISDNPNIDAVFNERYRIPDVELDNLNRLSLQRLLNPFQNHRTLKGFTGECLAHWIEKSFHPPLAITPPKPHSLEPAFDLIAVTDDNGEMRTTCFQSKATAGRAGREAYEAVGKYAKLHSGLYDLDLTNALTLLAGSPDVRERLAGTNWRRILLNVDRRDYGLVIAYDGDPPDGGRNQWPGNWATLIPGVPERRILITLPLADCNDLIARLAGGISARLA